MSKHTARLHIQRGAPGGAARIETFEVPFEQIGRASCRERV